MAQYLVTWEIDIEADSPEGAATQALEIQRDRDSEALSFKAKLQSTGEETSVDLLEGLVTKYNQIKYIRKVILKYGRFTTAEAQADCSPAINVLGDMSILIEEFGLNQCIAFTYVHSTCTCETNMSYEELEPEVIEQIFNLVKSWEEVQKELT